MGEGGSVGESSASAVFTNPWADEGAIQVTTRAGIPTHSASSWKGKWKWKGKNGNLAQGLKHLDPVYITDPIFPGLLDDEDATEDSEEAQPKGENAPQELDNVFEVSSDPTLSPPTTPTPAARADPGRRRKRESDAEEDDDAALAHDVRACRARTEIQRETVGTAARSHIGKRFLDGVRKATGKLFGHIARPFEGVGPSAATTTGAEETGNAPEGGAVH